MFNNYFSFLKFYTSPILLLDCMLTFTFHFHSRNSIYKVAYKYRFKYFKPSLLDKRMNTKHWQNNILLYVYSSGAVLYCFHRSKNKTNKLMFVQSGVEYIYTTLLQNVALCINGGRVPLPIQHTYINMYIHKCVSLLYILYL